jgi:hypothetical protein
VRAITAPLPRRPLIADFANSIADFGIPSAACGFDTGRMRLIVFVLCVSLSPALSAQQPASFPDFAKWEILDPGGRAMPYLNRPSPTVASRAWYFAERIQTTTS